MDGALQGIMYNDFKKRINSTKTPAIDGSMGKPFESYIKTPCTRRAPVLVLANSWEPMDIPNYSYAYFMGKYYYVTEVSPRNATHFEVVLELDPLATYKTDILNTTAYVEYAERGSVMITDPRMAATREMERKLKIHMIPEFTSNGCYVVQMQANGNGSSGIVSAVAMSKSQLAQYAQWLSQTHWAESQLVEFIKLPVSMWDSVVGCKYIPIALNKLTGTEAMIHSSGEDSGVNGLFITDWAIRGDFTIEIPWIKTDTGIEEYEDYTLFKPYTSISMYLPFVGIVYIDPELLQGSTKMSVEYAIDVVMGDIVYYIYSDSERTMMISTYSGNCAADLPVSGTAGNPMGAMQAAGQIMAGIGAATMGNALGAVSNIVSAPQNLLRTTQIKGSMSSRINSYMYNAVYLFVDKNIPADSPKAGAAIRGIPYCKTTKLSNLRGYVQTVGASVSAYASKEDIEYINAALDGGIYIE